MILHPVLSNYYSVIIPLRDYLPQILDGADLSDNQQPDCQLLDSALVCTDSVVLRKFQYIEPVHLQNEIIEKARSKLFDKKRRDVITLGYRKADPNSECVKDMSNAISNFCTNTVVTTLQGRDWRALLQRVGEPVMMHLLLDASVYLPLGNNTFCQVSGRPISELDPRAECFGAFKPDTNGLPQTKRKISPAEGLEPPRKRTCLRNSAHTQSLTDIKLARTRLYYARPSKLPGSTSIVVGLPPLHILNKLPKDDGPSDGSLNQPQEGYQPLEELIRDACSRHLLKYIFPRQFGLRNVFEIDKTSLYSLPDYNGREIEIRQKGPCKTPSRLKPVLEHMHTLIKRHRKCDYRKLRSVYCPTKLKRYSKNPLDSSVILEMMSEASQLQTQAQYSHEISDLSIGTIFAPGNTTIEKAIKLKPKFAEFTCSHQEVFRFASAVTAFVVPYMLWGSKRNLKVILQHVYKLINCRRYETLSLHKVLQDFRTGDCDWLLPTKKVAQNQREPVSAALKKQELVQEFVYWYFDGFLIPLLRTTFYATESSAFRNQVLYFRHDDWEALCKPLLDRLTDGTFERLDETTAHHMMTSRRLGFSFVRLLPKDTGVRPIVNLSRRVVKSSNDGNGYSKQSGQSINQILQAAFQILTYEKNNQPTLLGASVSGHNHIYKKLKDFKQRLLNSEGKLPKLYFVKVDVQACFDTIDQVKLLEILENVISEDEYMIQRFVQLMPVAGKSRKSFVKQAHPSSEHPHFLTYAQDLAKCLRHVVFMDQVVYPFEERERLLELLKEHITENIVKIGQDFFRQSVGIPQGSVLSTLLCTFFYGDLENKKFVFSKDPQSMLLRYIDDYMFVSSNEQIARNFLEIMQQGHPEYGCFISPDKTLTNFDYDERILGTTSPFQDAFPWCGLVINMSTLSVSVDYSRYKDTHIANTLTVSSGRNPGAIFRHKMLQMGKHKSHPLFSDSLLNSSGAIHLNIYQNFAITAMKMHNYLKDWGIDAIAQYKFILDAVKQSILFTYITIRSKSARLANENKATCSVQRSAVVWLGLHAFHRVLSRKATCYAKLLKSLQLEMALPRFRQAERRFKRLAKDGLTGMDGIAF